jgi:POLQ-like helicase
MIGRAGRAGKSQKGDSILMCDKKDFQKVANILSTKMNDTVSSYINNACHFQGLIINLIGTGLCKNFEELHDYSKCMLSRVQQDRFDVDMKAIFIQTLNDLLDVSVVSVKFQTKNSKRPPIFTHQGTETVIHAEDHFEINNLGKAALKSGMTLAETRKVEMDLRIAYKSLVLSQCLHLLYVVAPKEAVDSVYLDYKVYSNIILELDSSMLNTANIIGINEKIAVKMMRNPNFHTDMLYILKRFYVALILYDLWNGKDVFSVSKKFNVNRGIVHKLMYAASSQAYSIFKFCEVFEEFWIFKEIMEQFSKRLAYCCSTELLPLMELPNVKIVSIKSLL